MEEFEENEVNEDAVIFDDDDIVGFVAPRFEAVYICVNGHETNVTLSTNAEVPPTWSCAICTEDARFKNSDDEHESTEKQSLRAKRTTPWQKLLERRTEEELQIMLTERIQQLRNNEIARIHV